MTVVGHCVDFCGASFVRYVNGRLGDNLVRFKGIVGLVQQLDPSQAIDPDGLVVPALDDALRSLSELYDMSLKAKSDVKLRRTREAHSQLVSLCATLREVVGELRASIIDHDAKVRMGDDARRLAADLRRSDDVPAGHYARLAAAMSNAPQTQRRAAQKK